MSDEFQIIGRVIIQDPDGKELGHFQVESTDLEDTDHLGTMVAEKFKADAVAEPDRPQEIVHWIMTYAEKSRGDTGRYVVVEGRARSGLGAMEKPGGKRISFDRKSEAIAEAQRRNGYEPVDGNEQNYARQLNERGLR